MVGQDFKANVTTVGSMGIKRLSAGSSMGNQVVERSKTIKQLKFQITKRKRWRWLCGVRMKSWT